MQDFQLKASGNFVFFRADERRPGVVELFTVPALGGVEPFRENRLLPLDRSVVAYQPTPVGNFIVFVADQGADDVFELYSRTVGDFAPRKLSGAMVPGGDVGNIAITSDGTRVLYVADQESDEVQELYSVPVSGSASAVKLSGALVSGGDVYGSFLLSSATGRVVFLADKSTDEVYELYSAPLDGSAAPVRLNGPLAPGGDVGFSIDAFLQSGAEPWPPDLFLLSADGSTVVYSADQAADERYELFRVPTDGSAGPMRVHPVLAADRDVGTFRISPNGERVVYVADQDTNDVFETYSTRLDGSAAAVRISNAGQPAYWRAISPDSSRVVLQGGTVLFGARLDGSAPAVPLDSSTLWFRDLTISPDSQRLVYRLSRAGGGGGHEYDPCTHNEELRSVFLDGSAAAVRLEDPSGTLAVSCPPSDEHEVPFVISPDSSRVFYRWSDQGPAGLVSAQIDGNGARVTLSTGHVGVCFALNPSGTRVFFQADPTGGEAFDLFSASAENGTGRVKLNGRLARDTFADVALPDQLTRPIFLTDSTGERAVFSADRNVDQEFQLYSSAVDGREPPLRLTDVGVVQGFQLSPDREFVVYRATASANAGQSELYSVRSDDSQEATRLNGALPAGASVAFSRISADSASVVFSVGIAFGQPYEIYSVPIAGGTNPTLLTSNAGSWITLGAGPRLAFVRHGIVGLEDRLLSVPIAGGSTPLQLAPGLGGYHRDVQFTPDGSRILFEAGNSSTTALYVVPADGSASPLRLSGLANLGAAVLSPDGVWAVFAAGSGSRKLFSVRVDGSFGPVRLDGPQVSGGNVVTRFAYTDVHISADSSRVVYAADQDVNDVVELYIVPIDGSASPVKLNGALVGGGDVYAPDDYGQFKISPDGMRVLYLADQDVDEVVELYSAPSDGSASPVKLNAPLGAEGDVIGDFLDELSFEISPDSQLVVYAADAETDRLIELYLAPIDGSLAPRKLNGRLSSGGDQGTWNAQGDGIEAFEIAGDSGRVVYLATERNQVKELFSEVLTFGPRRSHVTVDRKP